MDNYYDRLEVSKKASKEIIEKAYKTLAKKYHPDLQDDANREASSEKMKLINEAYEILSDDNKRKEYDLELENEEKIKAQEELKKQQYNNANNNYNNQNVNNQNMNNQNMNNQEVHYTSRRPEYTIEELRQQQEIMRQEQQEYLRERERQYRQHLRNMGYRVKERWTMQKTKRLIQTIAILFIAILFIWIFPPTHKIIVETYESTPILKGIIDSILGIIIGIFKGIGTFFKGIFTKN